MVFAIFCLKKCLKWFNVWCAPSRYGCTWIYFAIALSNPATLTLFPAVPTSRVHHKLMHGGRQTIKNVLGNQQVTILLRNKTLFLFLNIIIIFIFFILISNLELLKNRKILGRKLKLTYSSKGKKKGIQGDVFTRPCLM